MAVKLRLARGGAKKRPYYRIVAADARAPRDGAYIEQLGAYNPMLPKNDENRVILNGERIAYWLSTGAQPTERVHVFLHKAGLVKDAPVFPEDKKATKNPGKYRKDQPKEEAPAAEEAPKEEAVAEEKPAENAEAAPAEEKKKD